ncbi:MAG: SCP2 sterol-binding domain-containing protein [Promethearchaeota archaeon]
MTPMDESTREEILKSIEETRMSLLEEENVELFKGWSRTVLYHFSDTNDFFSFEVIDGKPEPIKEGEIEDPDVRFRMTTETMIKLIRGELKGMIAFMTGKVKVKASMSDFSKLQKLFG